MRTSLQRMDAWARHLFPFAVTLALLLLSAVPTRIPGFGGVSPWLAVMSVYYWAIFRPDLLPPYAAFAIGLMNDIVTGTPFGIGALVMLLVQAGTAGQRRFFLGKPFLVSWWGFALVAGVSYWMTWFIISVMDKRFIEAQPVAFAYVLTVSLYPLVGWGLARTQMMFLKQA